MKSSLTRLAAAIYFGMDVIGQFGKDDTSTPSSWNTNILMTLAFIVHYNEPSHGEHGIYSTIQRNKSVTKTRLLTATHPIHALQKTLPPSVRTFNYKETSISFVIKEFKLLNFECNPQPILQNAHP